MSESKEKFIILKKTKYSESDLIIHALSPTGAKLSFMARSALKSKKRFGGGVLEPTHFVSLTYKKGRSDGAMASLTEATLLDGFDEIRLDYDKLELALFILNCAYHVAQEGDSGSQFLFNLVGHSLRALQKSNKVNLLKLHFCLKFLYQQGVMSVDQWMTPFLKANISDHQSLSEIPEADDFVSEYLDSIESQVFQYIKTADNSGTIF